MMIVAAIASFSGVDVAKAQPAILDGNTLYNACTTAGDANHSFCDGYLKGLYDDYFMSAVIRHRDPAFTCVGSKVDFRQVRDIVVAYMRDNPKKRDGFAAFIVQDALRDAFPKCAQ